MARVVSDPRIKEWFIAFTDRTNTKFWYDPLIKKGFKHCYAFTYDKSAGVWLIFDPAVDSLVIRALSFKKAERFLRTLKGIDTVLEVNIEKEPLFFTRHFQSCVTQIAHLVGVNIVIPTPYHLYCALVKRGARVSFLSKPVGDDDGRYHKNIRQTRENPRA